MGIKHRADIAFHKFRALSKLSLAGQVCSFSNALRFMPESKSLIALIFLLASVQEKPVGIWIHKEVDSKIEIYEKGGIFFGRLLSSNHPDAQDGMDILKDVICQNGECTGRMYDITKERWVKVKIEPKGQMLLLKMEVGFLIKEIRWFEYSYFERLNKKGKKYIKINDQH